MNRLIEAFSSFIAEWSRHVFRRLIFSQLMYHFPHKAFARIVREYSGDYKVQHFSCKSQFYCMAFGQLTYRNSLRDIINCLRASEHKLYHMA